MSTPQNNPTNQIPTWDRIATYVPEFAWSLAISTLLILIVCPCRIHKIISIVGTDFRFVASVMFTASIATWLGYLTLLRDKFGSYLYKEGYAGIFHFAIFYSTVVFLVHLVSWITLPHFSNQIVDTYLVWILVYSVQNTFSLMKNMWKITNNYLQWVTISNSNNNNQNNNPTA